MTAKEWNDLSVAERLEVSADASRRGLDLFARAATAPDAAATGARAQEWYESLAVDHAGVSAVAYIGAVSQCALTIHQVIATTGVVVAWDQCDASGDDRVVMVALDAIIDAAVARDENAAYDAVAPVLGRELECDLVLALVAMAHRLGTHPNPNISGVARNMAALCSAND